MSICASFWFGDAFPDYCGRKMILDESEPLENFTDKLSCPCENYVEDDGKLENL